MNNENSLSRELNPEQLDAVTYCDGPSLVIAGAGSGKTRVLTYKIAYLLQHGYEPWSILALTFTNKAAREMNNRIAALCGDLNTKGLWSGTFHSVFARILRMEHEAVGFSADFTIYDASDSRSLIKAITKELGLDDKNYKPSSVAGRISEAKNHLVLPHAYANDGSIRRRDSAEKMPETYRIYQIYQERLAAANAMDFDDLLLKTFLLLRDNEEVRQRYKQRFRYILVDEYQDTNMAQHRILTLLTDKNSRICVVGDDAQSIYGFRGADIKNILSFKEEYPTARLIKLECNYRSTQTIVEAANCIIRHNTGQIPKKVYAAGDKGELIERFAAASDKEEANKVVARIVNLSHNRHVGYNDIAILYRTNAQSRVFEEALQGARLPYRIYGGQSFYQRKEIKDVLAYCRLVANHDDEESFRRIINYPARGIGATTVQKVQLCAATHGTSLWNVARNPAVYGLEVNKGALSKLAAFCDLIEALHEANKTMTASRVVQDIVRRSGIAADFSIVKSAENAARQENVDELLGSIKSMEMEALEEEGRNRVSLPEYLSSVSLLSDTEEKDDGQPRITLMTVHSAKGLEFGAVFVAGMEDDLFPNANAQLYPKEMEEERRLFYVAVTRAKDYCYLSYAHIRFRYGQLQYCEPSPFLYEIDPMYVRDEVKTGFGGSSSYGDGNGYSQPWLTHESPQRNAPQAMRRTARAASFEEEFQTPSEDDFRSSMRPQADRYERTKYMRRELDETPKRVPPRTPPSNFLRAGVRRKVADSCSDGMSGNAPFAVGTRVYHERFGEGTVQGCEGSGDNAKVRVEFDNAGTKNLLTKFAKLQRR